MMLRLWSVAGILWLSGPLASAADKDLEKEARAFVQTLSRGEFDKAVQQFDVTMSKAAPPDKLKDIWKTVTGQVGAMKKMGATRAETRDKYRIIYVTCDFEKASLDVRVVFDREQKIAGFGLVPPRSAFKFPSPPYARPDQYTEKEVVVGEGEWALPGTWTLPKGQGPFPAVVLLAGSGPNDRDETILGNKPLRDLAWGLASQQIAVLRFDKRTNVHKQKVVAMLDRFTLKDEVIDDAQAAIALLRKTDKVDPRRIFVLGHSLGALAAPRLAEQVPDLAGIVMLAGNARPLEDLVLEQLTYLYSLDPDNKAEHDKELATLREKVARVKDAQLLAKASPAELPLGVTSAYWQSLNEYNQTATVAKLKMPILVLQGERDYQVTMADFALWQKALQGKPNAQLKSYPELNHLFMSGKGKSKPAEYQQEAHVSPNVINDVANWIKER